MTGLLASVNSLTEAQLVLDAGADIIDLKQPAAGALGALDLATITTIVEHCQGLRPISATIGDLPMQPQPVFDAIQRTAQTGVDYIKIGFFPEGDTRATLEKLAELSAQQLKLIAVLFADQQPDFALLDAIKQTGFTGVMLDTMDKRRGSLRDVMPRPTIAQFVEKAKTLGLIVGLAGSLRFDDIAELRIFQPDYLGFRGALCIKQQRAGLLDIDAIIAIRQAMDT